MKIDYIKNVVKGPYCGIGYTIKGVEMCCDDMKNSLIANRINMSKKNPRGDYYYLGLVDGRNRSLISYCPYCRAPIVLHELDEEIHDKLEDYWESVKFLYWDEFLPYDFNSDQRFGKEE